MKNKKLKESFIEVMPLMILAITMSLFGYFFYPIGDIGFEHLQDILVIMSSVNHFMLLMMGIINPFGLILFATDTWTYPENQSEFALLGMIFIWLGVLGHFYRKYDN